MSWAPERDVTVMFRLRSGRRGPRIDLTRSAPAATRHTRAAITPPMLSAVPDEHRRLSHGVLVRASVLARVLGLRLLALDATITLAPARVRSVSAAGDLRPIDAWSGLRGPLPRVDAVDRRLVEAVHSMHEGRELLERTRFVGPLR